MTTRFSGEGNLGQHPELQYVNDPNNPDVKLTVVNLRVYFDNSVPVSDADGITEFEDRGGFWLDVNVWGARAVKCAELLRKGVRLAAEGVLQNQVWEDKESGEQRSKLCLRARRIALPLSRLEKITFSSSLRISPSSRKRNPDTQQGDNGHPDDSAADITPTPEREHARSTSRA